MQFLPNWCKLQGVLSNIREYMGNNKQQFPFLTSLNPNVDDIYKKHFELNEEKKLLECPLFCRLTGNLTVQSYLLSTKTEHLGSIKTSWLTLIYKYCNCITRFMKSDGIICMAAVSLEN